MFCTSISSWGSSLSSSSEKYEIGCLPNDEADNFLLHYKSICIWTIAAQVGNRNNLHIKSECLITRPTCTNSKINALT